MEVQQYGVCAAGIFDSQSDRGILRGFSAGAHFPAAGDERDADYQREGYCAEPGERVRIGEGRDQEPGGGLGDAEYYGGRGVVYERAGFGEMGCGAVYGETFEAGEF